jgi:hypothetical protein
MNITDRLSKLEERAAASGPVRYCDCSGDKSGTHWVTCDKAGNVICEACGGRLPPGFVVVAPPGTVPSHPDHPDEPVILSVVPDNE